MGRTEGVVVGVVHRTDTWERINGRPGKRWQLTEQNRKFVLSLPDGMHVFAGPDVDRLRVARSWFRPVLRASMADGTRRQLRGLRSESARALREALGLHHALLCLDGLLIHVLPWAGHVSNAVARSRAKGRWISHEMVEGFLAQRPLMEDGASLRSAIERARDALTDWERDALDFYRRDLRKWIASVNDAIVQSELQSRKEFFKTVETSPLSDEQARAVVCFDNRVNLIAAAGSGKTSVMVARTAYAIDRGIVPPHRILLVAFNRDAALELRERLARRLKAVGLLADGLTATTFHAFGLGLIGQATGRKPRLARWLEHGQDVNKVGELIDLLRDSSLKFRYTFDTFRLLFARARDDSAAAEPDSWDPVRTRYGYRTFSGKIVRSQGERIIADFLYISGVDFEYETVYPHVAPTAARGEYRPDFYYPAVDVWHEHWALDAAGNPPREFVGYRQNMARKQAIHRQFGTSLIETTWASIMGTDGLASLEMKLTASGLELDWNPDREISNQWAKPPEHVEMAKLVRTFMAHVKSNSLTPERIEARLARNPQMDTPRTRHFLSLFWPIYEAWQAALAEEGVVDFEDMLVQAADLLEAGIASRDYDLVLVDEFQDVSLARSRLVKGLVSEPGKYLLTVGDDWQAINRFAGADISVMTDFHDWFGKGPTLYLSKTFRCTQEICDVSSTFVTKNPRQIQKNVTAANGERGPRVVLHYAAGRDYEDLSKAVQAVLERIAIEAGAPDGRSPQYKPSVFVLGRYNFDYNLTPRVPKGLSVAFKTVHSAKGLEADYVIVPNVSRGRYGFPSEIVDDPVLNVAMATPDDYPHSEERRLFYVALTRARRQVFLIAAPGKESAFVTELVQEGHIDVAKGDQYASETQLEVCPACTKGALQHQAWVTLPGHDLQPDS